MDKAYANKLLEIFVHPGEAGELIQCMRAKRLQYLFDTTRGLSDRDLLVAVLMEYEDSPRCVFCALSLIACP